MDHLASTTYRIDIEQKLQTIWQDLFETQTVATTDNFFDLGGNSLAALKLIAEVEDKYGSGALTPEQLYRTPVFHDVVSAIEINVC